MGTVWVVVGSLVAAVFAYVFQILGGRMLGAEAFAPIGVLWTVQFLAMQVLYQPLEHLVNREVSNRRAPGMGRVAAFGAAAGLAAAGILALTRDLYVDHGLYVLFAGLLVSAYALFGYVRGRLAGEGRFRAFAALTAGEATLRLVAALALVWVGGALGLATAMVLAPLLAIAWLRPSGLPSTRGDLARDLRPLVAASIFAQGLLGLAPLAVAALGATAATVSVVFMTFTVYRGPLWVMQGVMARLLPVLVELVRVRDHARLRRWMGGIAASAAASAGLAALAGAVLAPPVLAWLVGADFRPSPGFSAMVAAGVVLAGGGGFMNQVLLALGWLRSITAGWAFGFAVATVAALALPATPELRVGGAFLLGEVAAVAALSVLYLRKVDDVRVPAPAAPPADLSVPG
jgi:O-antigen/teichoic acid export membrane protein